MPVSVTVDGKRTDSKLNINQLDRPVLRVDGNFPVAGDYQSRIVIFYSGKRWPSIPLIVTRQRNAVSVEIDAVDARRATAFLTADAEIRFFVQENAGHSVSFDTPVLVDFALKEGDKTLNQATYKGIDLEVVDPKSGEKHRVGTESTDLTLGPRDNRQFLLNLIGITNAGEYTGILRVSNRDSSSVDRTVTVFVKKSGWIAFAFIFLGVCASWTIRFWTNQQRPKLELLRRIADLGDDLDTVKTTAGTLSEIEAKVFDGLGDLLKKAKRDLDRSSAKDVPATLDALGKRIEALPKWLNEGRRLTNIESSIDVKSIRTDWNILADNYFLTLAGKDEAFNASLEKIDKDLDGAIEADLIKRIDTFASEIDEYKKANPEDVLGLETEIGNSLDAAKQQPSEEALAKAKAKYSRFLASKMTVLLQAAPPLGFSPEEWTELANLLKPKVAGIANETDPQKAISLYNEVNTQYLEAVLDAATRQGSKVKNALMGDSTHNDDEKKKMADRLDEAIKTLKSVKDGLVAGNSANVIKQYEQCAGDIASVTKGLASGGGERLSGTSIAAAPAELLALVHRRLTFSASPQIESRPARKPSTADRLNEVIRRYDFLLNLGILLIATVLGMKLLWSGDPVWGGWTSYSIAFLWGLGLQQVGGAGFEGVSAITKQLTE